MNIRRDSAKRNCEICGSEGLILHEGALDHIHGIAGEWNYRKCRNDRCALVWLDPPVLGADLHLLYGDYFTHRPIKREANRWSSRIVRRVREEYVRSRFGSRASAARTTARLYAGVAYLFHFRRKRIDAEYMYLPRPCESGSRLLDVGCGNGDRLRKLIDCGWSAIGIDSDPAAIDCCRQFGLDARVGPLEGQGFGEDRFDAIVLNHVIEHVSDPGRLLTECLKVASPGAIMVMATPNASSLLHRLFGRFWRGVEAPRHQRLFNARNIESLSIGCGWRVERTFTTSQMADFMLSESLASLRFGTVDSSRGLPRFVGSIVMLVLSAVGWVFPAAGEEIVIVSRKGRTALRDLNAPYSHQT